MGTSFSEKVHSFVRRVPLGKITTYKIIAEKIGGKAYRAVGAALKSNPHPIIVPCHRVICSDGNVGGYCGIERSQKKIGLLRKEGIRIRNGRVEQAGEFLWKG